MATQAFERTLINQRSADCDLLPLSVIVAVRNEEENLARCLESLTCAGEVHVVDSFSTDATPEIARLFGAKIVQFHYEGGWPKKRQWALNTLPLAYEWVLLLDADESLTPELVSEIQSAIQNPTFDGYFIGLDMYFLGRRLRHCGARFYKLSLFRRGKGRFECRTAAQDPSMCDMEVHEHVVVNGKMGSLRHRLEHRNVASLSRYIRKHDEYSNWEARVWSEQERSSEMPADLFGSQAQRRRWLKQKFFRMTGSSILLFLYRYVFCLGFLDGIPGLIYCAFQAIQCFHVKAKLYEMKVSAEAGPQLALVSGDDHVRH